MQKRKELSDEIGKRLWYRTEFLKRDPEFQGIKQKLEKGMSQYGEKGLSPNILTECMNLFKDSGQDAKDIQESILELIESRIEQGEGLDDEWGLARLVASEGLSSIEIVSARGGKIVRSSSLNHFEPDQVFYGKGHALEAVDKEEKTILIKVHLDRKKEEVKRDIEFLYDLLRYEAKTFEFDLDLNPKRPRWDEYEKYLLIYDLKDGGMEWSEIANMMFPDRMKKHEAPHRKTRKRELPSESAVKAVKHFYEEAREMIEGGKWRQI